MNFFGHAALAASHFADATALTPGCLPKICLGAMLPDFWGMLRLGRPSLCDSDAARGVWFHHATDKAFHDLPSFLKLTRDAHRFLSARALPRGPARAVAHIGVEILLDEVIAGDEAARAAYSAALEVPLHTVVEFHTTDAAERGTSLQQALRSRRLPREAPPPDLVALASRPRLAVAAADESIIAEWVQAARAGVLDEAPALLAALRTRLAESGPAE